MKHTALPWAISRGAQNHAFSIEGPSETVALIPFAREYGREHANAEHIIRACNLHDELVEVCQMVLIHATLGEVRAKGVDRVKSYKISPEVIESIKQTVANATK